MIPVLIWTISSFLGLVLHISGFFDALNDRRAAGGRLPESKARIAIADSSLRSELMRLFVQVIFLFLGLGAFFMIVEGRFIVWGLVAAQVGLAINSIGERLARRRINKLIAAEGG